MKINQLQPNQLQLLNQLTNKLSVKKLSVGTIQGIIKLQEELTKQVEDLQQTQEKILKSYGVEQVEGRYDWTGHKDEEEIGTKLNELFTTQIEIKKQLLNFAKEDEVIEAAKETDMPLNEMAVLLKFLSKNQK